MFKMSFFFLAHPVVCMYILISYSLSDSNNLEGDRALLQYSPTTIAIRN